MLRVEGPAAIEIQHLSTLILERVNRFFGWQAIGRIALRQAPLKRVTKPPAPSGPDPAQTAALAAEFATDIRWHLRRHWPGSRLVKRNGNGRKPQNCDGGGFHSQRPTAAQRFVLHQEFPLKITRREFCEGTAALTFALLATSALGGQAFAQKAADAELLKPSPLGEMTLGPANAPVTIIEYASMTCSHCAHFATTTMPELKKRYIDTGKVRYMLREFPLDPLAAAGFMLARCAANNDPNKYYALIETLFHQQTTGWFRSRSRLCKRSAGRPA